MAAASIRAQGETLGSAGPQRFAFSLFIDRNSRANAGFNDLVRYRTPHRASPACDNACPFGQ